MAEALMNQKQHIETIISKQSSEVKKEYRTRLDASIASVRFLLRQGLAFRGHDESNAPENLKLTSPDIQFDIINAAAEQMAIVLRYVDKNGHLIERFIVIEHVSTTTTLTLKATIDKLFSRYGLIISMIRRQGYDGASNMQGEFNGLKALILKENSCAFYIHCFAHQLQLALLAVAKKHI
ncbi:uncharacterized protein LOC115710698 [Cannabis sativa]|uniref:uncharacterized protein LOC115710698 n=1 Tax=Cannabis sativa TaxID=3483 RepID=UPI0011DF33B8|nr:uncharacterized protein LOC115710698 [Cannabis sativa]